MADQAADNDASTCPHVTIPRSCFTCETGRFARDLPPAKRGRVPEGDDLWQRILESTPPRIKDIWSSRDISPEASD